MSRCLRRELLRASPQFLPGVPKLRRMTMFLRLKQVVFGNREIHLPF